MPHQITEFGSRLLTFVLVALALLLFLSVIRVGRCREIKSLAFLNGLDVIVQTAVDDISVWVDLR